MSSSTLFHVVMFFVPFVITNKMFTVDTHKYSQTIQPVGCLRVPAFCCSLAQNRGQLFSLAKLCLAVAVDSWNQSSLCSGKKIAAALAYQAQFLIKHPCSFVLAVSKDRGAEKTVLQCSGERVTCLSARHFHSFWQREVSEKQTDIFDSAYCVWLVQRLDAFL